jgi:hypothetical protein
MKAHSSPRIPIFSKAMSVSNGCRGNIRSRAAQLV